MSWLSDWASVEVREDLARRGPDALFLAVSDRVRTRLTGITRFVDTLKVCLINADAGGRSVSRVNVRHNGMCSISRASWCQKWAASQNLLCMALVLVRDYILCCTDRSQERQAQPQELAITFVDQSGYLKVFFWQISYALFFAQGIGRRSCYTSMVKMFAVVATRPCALWRTCHRF